MVFQIVAEQSPVNGLWRLSGGRENSITIGISNSGRDEARSGQTLAWKHKHDLEVSSWTPVPTRLNDPDTFGVLILE